MRAPGTTTMVAGGLIGAILAYVDAFLLTLALTPLLRATDPVRELMDEVWFNDRGNQVTLVLRLDPGDALEGGVQA